MEHAIRCYPSLGDFKPKAHSVNIKIGSNDTLFWLKNDIIYLSKSDQLMYLFLDESGDLSPYINSARSTRFFVVGMIVVENRQALFSLKAVIKKTRRIKLKHTKYQHNELKGNKASITTKHFFYKELVKQLKKPWKLYFIVLDKAQHHITQEHTTHQLYNAMCNQLLQKVMVNRKYKNADLVVDKCKSPKQQKIFNHKLQRTWYQYLQMRIKS